MSTSSNPWTREDYTVVSQTIHALQPLGATTGESLGTFGLWCCECGVEAKAGEYWTIARAGSLVKIGHRACLAGLFVE